MPRADALERVAAEVQRLRRPELAGQDVAEGACRREPTVPTGAASGAATGATCLSGLDARRRPPDGGERADRGDSPGEIESVPTLIVMSPSATETRLGHAGGRGAVRLRVADVWPIRLTVWLIWLRLSICVSPLAMFVVCSSAENCAI